MSEQHSRQVGRQPRNLKISECPPALVGDAANVIYDDFLRSIRSRIDGRLGDGSANAETIAAVLTALATEHASVNLASYVSCAIRDAGSDIADSVSRLARAVENLTPAVEPPTLVRLRDVSRRIGISSESVMKLSRKGQFPAAIYLDESGVPFFVESDVDAWLASKVA
jgi:predicted DNA-binding transcriptional regulator AlpA